MGSWDETCILSRTPIWMYNDIIVAAFNPQHPELHSTRAAAEYQGPLEDIFSTLTKGFYNDYGQVIEFVNSTLLWEPPHSSCDKAPYFYLHVDAFETAITKYAKANNLTVPNNLTEQMRLFLTFCKEAHVELFDPERLLGRQFIEWEDTIDTQTLLEVTEACGQSIESGPWQTKCAVTRLPITQKQEVLILEYAPQAQTGTYHVLLQFNTQPQHEIFSTAEFATLTSPNSATLNNGQPWQAATTINGQRRHLYILKEAFFNLVKKDKPFHDQLKELTSQAFTMRIQLYQPVSPEEGPVKKEKAQQLWKILHDLTESQNNETQEYLTEQQLEEDDE